LSSAQMEDWRERLAATFEDMDLCFEGGESSRSATMRGVAVVKEAIDEGPNSTLVITHGNLITLILKHFDPAIGYPVWERLQNPDVYSVTFQTGGAAHVERLEL